MYKYDNASAKFSSGWIFVLIPIFMLLFTLLSWMRYADKEEIQPLKSIASIENIDIDKESIHVSKYTVYIDAVVPWDGKQQLELGSDDFKCFAKKGMKELKRVIKQYDKRYEVEYKYCY